MMYGMVTNILLKKKKKEIQLRKSSYFVLFPAVSPLLSTMCST